MMSFNQSLSKSKHFVAKGMSLYVQLKTKVHFAARENPPYVKVVETKGFFVAKAILGKMEPSNLIL